MYRKTLLSIFTLLMALLVGSAGVGAAGKAGTSPSANEQASGSPTNNPTSPLAPTGSAFTYQGRLTSAGVAANGQYDLNFSLWDATSGGAQLGGTISMANQAVTNGLFTINLDFGAAAFQGSARWLEMAVRPASVGAYTTLTPRQPLTPAPYAMSLMPGAVVTGTTASPLLALTNSGGGPAVQGSSTTGAGGYFTSTSYVAVRGDTNSNFNAALYGVNNGSGPSVMGQGTSGTGVYGSATTGYGVSGISTSSIGVSGSSTSGYGVSGYSNNNAGVYGTNTNSSSEAGVHGIATSLNGNGVIGEANNGSSAYGVWGKSTSGYGMYGSSTSGYGIYGNSTSGNGVYGHSGNSTGVYGSSTNSYGVMGNSPYVGVDGESTGGTGVVGHSQGSFGVQGSSGAGAGVYGTSTSSYGVIGETSSNDAYMAGVHGISDATNSTGVLGAANLGPGAIGVWGMSTSGYAGYFSGNVEVAGTLSKSAGSFKIDDPIDPANKYLSHSFVESPDMMNIYNGNVTPDANGEATVTMPAWFQALNQEFRYQLTTIGGFAPVYVAQEMQGNSFKIAGGKPGMKVSWQVTGIRHDAYADAHRIPVEQDKPANEKGYYLHPDLYGQPASKGMDNSRAGAQSTPSKLSTPSIPSTPTTGPASK